MVMESFAPKHVLVSSSRNISESPTFKTHSGFEFFTPFWLLEVLHMLCACMETMSCVFPFLQLRLLNLCWVDIACKRYCLFSASLESEHVGFLEICCLRRYTPLPTEQNLQKKGELEFYWVHRSSRLIKELQGSWKIEVKDDDGKELKVFEATSFPELPKASF